MRYEIYRRTDYPTTVTIPERKKFGGKTYELAEVFPNYMLHREHRDAIKFAAEYRNQGCFARLDAHSGYTAVYIRCPKR